MHPRQQLVRAFVALLASAALSSPGQAQAQTPDRTLVKYHITPESTDSAIHRFNNPHYIVFERSTTSAAPLLVFMPGTGGMPERTSYFADLAAHQGYRVIGLEYTDEPAVAQICPRDRDPACSEKFRQKRIFGDDVTNAVDNTPAEAIVTRLVKLLQYLDAKFPDEHWGTYLAGSEPDWSKIVVSGLSQGAGMAAYIAKKKLVARVVLFSSPWDFTGRDRKLAPWISWPSATPSDRWYAEYHAKENTADLLAQSYRLLGIPADNIRVFDGEPPNPQGDNPYHGSTIRLPVYVPQWQAMFGTAP